MITLKLREVTGHLLTDIDGKSVFLDTGCPLSVGRTGEPLVLGGVRFPVTSDPYWVKTMLDDVERELVHEHLDYVLGMDIVGLYRFRLDMTNDRAYLLPSKPEDESGVPITYGWDFNTEALTMRFPTIPVTLESEGRSITKQALWDSGCWLSCVPQSLIGDQGMEGTTSDFLVGYGRFTTGLYPANIKIGDFYESYDRRFGVLEANPEVAIIGTDIMRDWVVEADFPQKRLRFLRS